MRAAFDMINTLIWAMFLDDNEWWILAEINIKASSTNQVAARF